MGKITTIYLSDAEARRLKEFCDENQCTQYSALKIAVGDLLSKQSKEGQAVIPEEEVETIDKDNEDTSSKKSLQQLLQYLKTNQSESEKKKRSR